MRISRAVVAALILWSTAASAQPSYCDKAQCKAWNGAGWYVLYGGYFGNKMLKAGPFADQDICKAEAARLTKKNPEMVSMETGSEFFCLIVPTDEAARDYMIPA